MTQLQGFSCNHRIPSRSYSHSIEIRQFKYHWQSPRGDSSLQMQNIPSDLNYDDTSFSAIDASNAGSMLLPNTDIHELSGAVNLGVIIWTFVLYNGLFTTSGQPSDWILTPISRILNQSWQPWYQDFKQGFQYQVPYQVDLIRIVFFVALSWLVNQGILALFDGDSYWCWAIGACLAIPSGLISVSRDKRPTRAYASIESRAKVDFNEFANMRLDRVKGKSSDESRIILAFLQQWKQQRRQQNNIDGDEDGDREVDGFDELLQENEVSCISNLGHCDYVITYALSSRRF
jgi:hypothetical protein